MAIKIDYQLTGVGWSQCVITCDDKTITTTASYLGDALGDLAKSVLSICNGHTDSSCSFAEEPGEYRWTFYREGDQVLVEIFWFDELWGNQDNSLGKSLFQTRIPIKSLRSQMITAMEKVLIEYGESGYREKWVEHDFPMTTYRALRARKPELYDP